MSDLIDRQTVINAIEDEWHGCTGEYPASTIINDTCQRIENLPSAEPQERTGRWIQDRSGAYCCSKCMEPCATYVMMKPRDKFCKMCGAKMEVDKC